MSVFTHLLQSTKANQRNGVHILASQVRNGKSGKQSNFPCFYSKFFLAAASNSKKEENSSLRLMIVVMYYDILRTYIKAIVPWLTMCKITLD